MFNFFKSKTAKISAAAEAKVATLQAAIAQGAGQGLIDRLVENVAWAAAQDNDTWTSKRSLYASFRGEIINVRTGRVIKQIRRKEFGGILVTLNKNGSVKFVKTV